MSSNLTESPTPTPWLRYVGAAMMLAVAYIGFAAWTATPTPKLAFEMTAKYDDRELRVGGSTAVADGKFGFDGTRIDFAGRIADGKVAIDGRIAPADSGRTKPFTGEATIVDGVTTVTLRSNGYRIGSIKFDFDPS